MKRIYTILLFMLSLVCFSQPTANDYYESSEAHRAKGELMEAISDLGKAIEIFPLTIYFSHRGGLYYELELFDDAINNFLIVTKKTPYDAQAYSMLGSCYHRKEAYGTALQYFEIALSFNPKDVLINFSAGLSEKELKHYNKAIDLFTTALETEKQPLYYYHRGLCHIALENDSNAVLDFSEVIKLVPEDPGGYVNRGGAYANLGRCTEALTDLNFALKINPNIQEAITLKQWCLNKLKKK